MRKAVNNIQSDAFFFTTEDSEKKGHDDKDDPNDPRNNMRKLGNKLVEATDTIIKQSRLFFRNFNRHFRYVMLDTIVFAEADYLEISVKEVQEITAIFASYDIFINQMETEY